MSNDCRKISGQKFGFTLIELSVVLIVIALITGMGMMATLGTLESARRASTQNKLDVIEKALMDFRNRYDRLPCPGDITLTDSSSVYGLEAANVNECTGGSPAAEDVSGNNGIQHYLNGYPPTVSGSVPARTLGLPDEYMFDGWGRRFTYVVDAHVTMPNAFSIIPPNANNCSLWVKDSGGGYRSGDDTRGGAMYVLVSHGPNGHGAYVSGGSRVSAGSTNGDELTNCRCDSAAQSTGNASLPYFVQKEATENPTDARDRFDDIVRFKERWQMMNEDDYLNIKKYREYQLMLAVPFVEGESPAVGFYKRGCDGWVHSRNQADLSGAVGGGGVSWITIMELTFSRDNDFSVFYYRDTGGTTHCTVYDFTSAADPQETWGCINLYDGSGRVATSRNGYTAFGTIGGTELLMNSGMRYNRLSNFFSPSTDAPSVRPIEVALSRNANYMMLTDKSTYASVYGRTGDVTFKKLVSNSQPVTSNYNRIQALAFSPDDRFLAVGESTVNTVKIWQIGSGSLYAAGTSPFTLLTTLSTGSFAPALIRFSPDGQYMAVRIARNDTNLINIVKIYKISGTDFSEVTIDTDGDYGYFDPPYYAETSPYLMEFTPNNTLLISYPGCCVVTLDRIDALTFRQTIPIINPVDAFASYTGPKAMAVHH